MAGPSSGGTVAATTVVVGWPHSNDKTLRLPGGVAVEGTVADASPGGFTVVTSAGTRVPVTTSSGTSISVFHASLSPLRTGETTVAIGRAGRAGPSRR